MQNLRSIGIRFQDAEAVRAVPGDGDRAATVCEQCDGSGWSRGKQGGDTVVSPCPCQDAIKAERALARAGIPELYRSEGFETYRTQTKAQEWALIKARGYVDRWPLTNGEGLAFIGTVGVGKTHLAVAVLKGIAARGGRVGFADMRHLLRSIQETYSGQGRTEAEVLRPILTMPVLALDEVGAGRVTDWSFDVVSRILNTRYNEGLATIITSNFAMRPPGWTPGSAGGERYVPSTRQETLGDRVGAPMLSRLQQMCDLIEMDGPDYRARNL